MGLFGKKEKKKLPSVFELPDLPPLDQDLPAYESPFNKAEPFKASLSSEDVASKNRFSQGFNFNQHMPEELPVMITKPPRVVEDKPLFVKIDKYKDAVYTLEEIKSKLEDAEKVLRNLERIKKEEEKEFSSWQHDLEAIKEKLLKVDTTLFEA